jgi:hypothetical protein
VSLPLRSRVFRYPDSEGDTVQHPRFGTGEVVESIAGKVVVRFGEQRRTFVPEIAPLSKIAVSD